MEAKLRIDYLIEILSTTPRWTFTEEEQFAIKKELFSLLEIKIE